jgi:hypothetical protein
VDQHRIRFRCAEPPAPNPDQYADELLDAYLFVEDADALFAEYRARGEFTRGLADTPWDSREFVVKDCGGPYSPSARSRSSQVSHRALYKSQRTIGASTDRAGARRPGSTSTVVQHQIAFGIMELHVA